MTKNEKKMKKNDKKEKKRDNFAGPIMKGKMQKKKQNDKKEKKRDNFTGPSNTNMINDTQALISKATKRLITSESTRLVVCFKNRHDYTLSEINYHIRLPWLVKCLPKQITTCKFTQSKHKQTTVFEYAN